MSDDYIAKTIEAYDDAPEKYVSTTDDMVYYAELKTMFQYAPNKSFPILDVGSGSGRDAREMSQMGYNTVSIDLSRRLLKCAQASYSELDFRYMDVRSLDFDDNSFGGVWCNAVLLHLKDEDLEKALGEIRRVLVPGGVLAVSFKEGTGSRVVIEKFSSDLARFYNFKNEIELNKVLRRADLDVKESRVVNEKMRFGPDKRDLNWVWSFAVKAH